MDTRIPQADLPLVKGDRMFEHAIITVSCLGVVFVGVALAALMKVGYRNGYKDGHRDGTMQTISNIWNDVEIGVE